MDTDDTLRPIVPPPAPSAATPPPSEPETVRRPRRRLWWVLGVLAAVLATAVIAAALIPVPYITLSPGATYGTGPRIHITGPKIFPDDGEVLFTTVSVGGVSNDVSVLEALRGWIDDDIDVVPEKTILGDQTPEQNRTENQLMMATSKQTAVFVALEHLGYDVKVHGTGAQVISVVPDSPGQGVLRPGDTITGVDGEPVALAPDLAELIRGRKPGEQITLAIEDADRKARSTTVTLASRDDEPAAGFLGVRSQTRDLRYDTPFDVTIDTENVGGPSAGMAFTLGILDALTAGSLTGGERVAVTGTIEPDGTIGAVGGVAQKMAAARAAGVALFLVPAAEYPQAKRHAGRSLRVEPVDTLNDALKALASLGGNALALPKVNDGKASNNGPGA